MNEESRGRSTQSLQPQEQYAIARAQIEHENSLVGHRITWYLTFQGLLFTAFFVAIGLFEPSKFAPGSLARQHLAIGVFFLGFLGIGSSIVAFALIRAAYSQIDSVKMWWVRLRHPKDFFPPLSGEGHFAVFGYKVSTIHFLMILGFVWVGFLSLFASVAFRLR
jgi:hypothetical protein